MTSILRRIFRAANPADPPRIRVYSRAQCGCCEKALAILRSRQRRHRYIIEVVDVDDDPALAKAHGETVPVVEIDGKIRFRGVVNPVLLDRILDAESTHFIQESLE